MLKIKRRRASHSVKTGLSFGSTSGVLTTLGLMVGLFSGTGSKLAVIGGVLTIALADSLSDAFGIHIAEESEGVHSDKEIWQSTFSTFLTKLIFALTFVVPVLLFTLKTAIVISVIWGLLILTVLSWKMARSQKRKSWQLISEHLAVATFVVMATHFLGRWIASVFG